MVASPMKLGLKFPERLAGVLYPVREALEDLIIGIEKGWAQEHLGTGRHNAITAASIGHPTPAETSVLAVTSGLRLEQGPFSLSKSFLAAVGDPAVLSPTQITATTNDYSPAGLDQGLIVRLNVDADRTINGLRRPQPVQARMYWLINTTTFVVTLAHEATGSTAGNRFYCPGAVNYYLPAYGAVAVLYDVVTLRWRVLDSSPPNVHYASSSYGLGTATADDLLHLLSAAAQVATVESSHTNGPLVSFYDGTTRFGYVGSALALLGTDTKDTMLLSSANSKDLILRAPSGRSILTRIGGTTAVTVDSNANLGIGVVPTAPFHVEKSNASDFVGRLINTHGTDPYGVDIFYSAAAPNGVANGFFRCRDSGTNRAVMRSNGGLANFQANNVDLSDAAAKHIYGPAGAERERFRRLAFQQATYKDSPQDTPDVMLTAQEVQEVYPSLVTPFDEEQGLLGLRTQGIAMRAYKVIQELDQALLRAEQRIAALEAAGAQTVPPDRIQP